MFKRLKSALIYYLMAACCLIFATSTLAQTPVAFQYAYDSAGRLTEAVDSSGNALIYAYDAAGNLLSITKQAGVLTAIFGATDANGALTNAAAPGQTVTLTGIGLGDCPNVTVTVDGIAATITGKTTNTITIIIPAGASNGQIVVNTCHGSAVFTLTIGSVIVTPSKAVLTPGRSVQFSASVLPPSLSQNVTWSVEGIDGGDVTVGTITSAGLYTAPSSTGIVHIRATSMADPELYGEAQVSVLSSSDVYEALSPGVSVLLGTLGGPVSPTPLFVLSPGVSVGYAPSLGALGSAPVYALSPGVSVVIAPPTGGTSTAAVFAFSPGVSVQNGPRVTLGGSGVGPVYVLAPPVSVQNGPRLTGGAGTGETTPVFVLSPGVSVQMLAATTGVGGGGGDDSGSLFIISPGVSIAPVPLTGHSLTPSTGRALRVAGLTPPQMVRGKAGLVTVTGAHLDDAQALGFVNEAGRLDPDITVQSAVVKDGGQTMTLRLSVRPGAAPGRRRLIVWTLPRMPLGLGSGVHFLP